MVVGLNEGYLVVVVDLDSKTLDVLNFFQELGVFALILATTGTRVPALNPTSWC